MTHDKVTPPRTEYTPIFSGDYSKDMWDAISSLNATSSGERVRRVLYLICCRLQELERRLGR